MLVRDKGNISPNTQERPLSTPHSAPQSSGLGFESQFLAVRKGSRGKGKVLSQPWGLTYGRISLIAEKC